MPFERLSIVEYCNVGCWWPG